VGFGVGDPKKRNSEPKNSRVRIVAEVPDVEEKTGSDRAMNPMFRDLGEDWLEG